jgi:hypothetical protein
VRPVEKDGGFGSRQIEKCYVESMKAVKEVIILGVVTLECLKGALHLKPYLSLQ